MQAKGITSCNLCVSFRKEKIKPIFTEERKERAEWEKLAKEVDNADREYSLRHL